MIITKQTSSFHTDSSDDEEEEDDEVGDLVVDQTQNKESRRSKRRASSKIFSMARNERMNQIYKYENNKVWTFKEMIEFPEESDAFLDGENEELTTEEMRRFIPCD